MIFQNKDILKLGIYPVLVFMLNYSAYNLFPEFYISWRVDIPIHILGGLSIAYSATSAIYLAERKNVMAIEKLWMRAAVVVALVITAAVWWEFYEFLSDRFLGTHNQPNNADTIKDLFMGMLGGLIFCLNFLGQKKKQNY